MQLLPPKSPESIGLVGHTIIDYPNPQDARQIIEILVNQGAALIELQIPFSEPIADGPVFAKANHEAIAKGVNLAQCYDFMAEMTQRYAIPFVFMTYANIALKQGFAEFVKASKQAGAQGAIIPDLPLDIANDYVQVCRAENFAPITVVSPNMAVQRLEKLQPYFDGFIYAVARAGVTGTKTQWNEDIITYLQQLRHYSDLPLAVGFGISSKEDLLFLQGTADYAVIGTQTIRAYEAEGLIGVEKLWQSLS